MKKQRAYFVYILTNWNHKVMYIGITNDLHKRIHQHKNKLIDGFTKKYNINKLVYYESTEDVQSAITREKELKGWVRKKKNTLIITINPEWKDLGAELNLI